MKKRELDMLHGSIWDKLPRYAFPVAATAILEQLFNASDIAVVGNFTGEYSTAAVAAVGANSSLIALVVNLFVGVALGANVVIANAMGRGDREAVSRAVHSSIVVALLGGVIAAIIGELIAEPVLTALDVPEDVLPMALMYLRIYLLGLPVILLYNFESAIFRSVGETRAPLIALFGAGCLNVVLNLFFVAVLGMMVDGVAIATVVSNAVSSALLYRRLRTTDSAVRVEPRMLRINWRCLSNILRIGLPAGVQGAMFAISNIVIQSAINSLGTVVMAASSAAFNIEVITYNILNAYGQACSTFTGQNYGAGQTERCRKTLFLCLAEGLATLAVVIAVVLSCGKTLLAIFNDDPAVIETGYIRLMLVMLSHTLSLTYDVMSGYMRGFGISLAPAVLTTLGVCGVRICWVELVFPHSRTFRNLMTVYPVSLGVTAALILAALLYYRPSRRRPGGAALG